MANRTDEITYSLWCNLFSALLPQAMANTLLDVNTYPKVVAMFGGNIFNYFRDDLMVSEMPGLSIYPEVFAGQDMHYFHTGVLNLDIFVPPQIARARKTEVSMVMAEALTLVIQSQPFFYTIRTLVPGLVKLGFTYNFRFVGIQKIRNVDVTVVKGTMGYSVDKNQYYQYLKDNGLTVEDPCDVVLPLIQDYILNVQNIALEPPTP